MNLKELKREVEQSIKTSPMADDTIIVGYSLFNTDENGDLSRNNWRKISYTIADFSKPATFADFTVRVPNLQGLSDLNKIQNPRERFLALFTVKGNANKAVLLHVPAKLQPKKDVKPSQTAE